MRYAYETLLRLYPSGYRLVFAKEMTAVFEQAAGDCQPRGLLAYAGFLSTEFFGLLSGAFAMWTDEYVERSRRRISVQFLISLLAGAAVTVFFQSGFLGMLHLRAASAPPREAPPLTQDLMLPLIMAGGVLLFIGVFSVAFVWNMRIIGNRTGRLKPIWMPAPSARRRGSNKRAANGQSYRHGPGGYRR